MRGRTAEHELRHLRSESAVSRVEDARMALAWMFSAIEEDADRLDVEGRSAAHNDLKLILHNFEEGMRYLWDALNLARDTIQQIADTDQTRHRERRLVPTGDRRHHRRPQCPGRRLPDRTSPQELRRSFSG
jgi:hypothetical protein